MSNKIIVSNKDLFESYILSLIKKKSNSLNKIRNIFNSSDHVEFSVIDDEFQLLQKTQQILDIINNSFTLKEE